jgi:putative endopeptidase
MTLPSGIASDDFSADIRPQDDLYRHVNGAWLDRTEIPSDKARWGSFMELAEQAEKDVRVIVDEAQNAEGTEARKVGDVFVSFMDTERIAALGLEPIQDQLASVDAVADIAGFLRTVSDLDRQGVTNVIGVFIEPDPGDPERYVPFFTQAGISLPDEQYYREDAFAEIREAFVAHVERMLALAKIAEPAESATRILALETRVAGHHWDNVKSRDAVAGYNLMSWDAVVELAGIDLAPWREAILGDLDEDAFAEVNVMQPSFLTGLGELLTEENLDDWKTWLRWKIVRSAAPYLTDDLIEENFSFVGTTLQGVPEMRARWKGPGRRDRQGLRRAPLPARGEGADGRARAERRRGVPRVDHEPRVDDARDAREGAREARHLRAEDRLPGEVDRLLEPRHRPHRPRRQRAPGGGLQPPP